MFYHAVDEYYLFDFRIYKEHILICITGLHEMSVIQMLAFKWLRREEKEESVGNLPTQSIVGCCRL